jgi:succinate dehydrogenase / fumarate reductase cytochrome b subunit
MSAVAAQSALHRTLQFWQATIGKKYVMAVTGAVLFLFVLGHMIGNLQIYQGPAKIDAYAHFLKSTGGLLWAVRLGLLACAVLHMTAAFQLWSLKRRARPDAYAVTRSRSSSFASRTMYLTGPGLFFFLVYHLAHFTIGSAHPDFDPDLVYRNVILGFREPVPFAAYILAMSFLGFHLVHGVWSMFQSLGVNHPKYMPKFRLFATLATALIVGGNISIPVAVMTRLIGASIP